MSASVRRRRRTVEERIGAQLRHGKPGDLAGRGEPLKRDRGAIVSRAGGPSGGDSTTVIEHVTMQAVAGQTIAAGGGTAQWGTILAPPTDRRGFRTASATLAADGAVGDIPIDVTGELELVLKGKWGDYPDGFKCEGDLVITRTRSGATAAKTITLTPATRTIQPPNEIAWDVRAGDTITITLPNDSGSDQTLAELELQLRVISVAPATSTVAVPESPVTVYQQTAGWTSGADWPDESIIWIWPREDDPTSQPAETTYMWSSFSLPSAGDVRVWLSIDNIVDFYIDGVLIRSTTNFTGLDRGNTKDVVALGSGLHTVSAEATNTATSPAGLRVAIYEYSGGVDGDLLLATTLDWSGSLTQPSTWPRGA